VAGIGVAFGLAGLLSSIPLWGTMLIPQWSWEVFARAIGVALALGIIGGLYPAFRATRLQPVEALRYE
jgi:putative ABC transport system permease protein